MTDIFFSYKSDDRKRVRLVRDAFAALGFEVFWDQQVPTGVDWDTWIRRHLAQSKCAVVFWSITSVASDNVRHEATVAKRQNKLIPVLLEPLTPEQFPIGHYTQQAANLIDWDGNVDSTGWRNLRYEVESKVMPSWVRHRIDELEAELVAERARREDAETRDKVLQTQIDKELLAQRQMQRERESAVDEATTLKQTVQELTDELLVAKQKEKEMAEALRQIEQRYAEAVTKSAAEAKASDIEKEKGSKSAGFRETDSWLDALARAPGSYTATIYPYFLIK